MPIPYGLGDKPTVQAAQTVSLTEANPIQEPLAEEKTTQVQEYARVGALLESLEKEASARQRRRLKWLLKFISQILPFAFAYTLLSGNVPVAAVAFMIFAIILLISGSFYITRKRKKEVNELTQYRDLRTVGVLTEALEYGDINLRERSANALIKLLPQLRPDDASLLNKTQRGILHRALKEKNSRLTFAILQALEQVGDELSLPFVTALASPNYYAQTMPPNEAEAMRNAAEACLTALKARSLKTQQSATLLRPSSISEAPADTLLRPAQGISDPKADDLLRASASQETGESV